jgi:hypothetical protein
MAIEWMVGFNMVFIDENTNKFTQKVIFDKMLFLKSCA